VCSTPHPQRYTLKKKERLHLKRDVDALFASSRGFIAYPLRVLVHYRPLEEGEQAGVAILVVVAKKYHKRANKRNRIKRLIRETYRLNKYALQTLATERGLRIHLGLLSVAKELPNYSEVERGMLKALAKASAIVLGQEAEERP